ncbi:SCO family protein [Allorhizobium sp. BGMRC 0089]|uniref:SCO family protein n=1 Tax=Allorhizobium sonneratiae TaxID=2934936 RepID=UPI002034316F|nr:SCO family protein [Allorhizobium sonneratiae]MCM2294238.1 SCO family protein [Allorhizobium sonneratiae]
MKPVRVALWVCVTVLAAIVAFLVVEIGQSRQQVAEAAYGVPFTLVDQHGKAVSEAVMRGKPTVLFFGYTHCPDVCPTTLFELDGWLKKVDPKGGHLNAFFVTVDPERDTPDVLNRYVSNVSDRITGLSGAPDKVMAMVKGFHIYAKKVPVDANDPTGDYTMDHTASVFLLDSQGRFKGTISYGEDPDVAVKKLERLIAG